MYGIIEDGFGWYLAFLLLGLGQENRVREYLSIRETGRDVCSETGQPFWMHPKQVSG